MEKSSIIYKLKNGMELLIRQTEIQDANKLIEFFNIVDRETKFLAREPGEFDKTQSEEEEIIEKNLKNKNEIHLLGFIGDELVGQCSANRVKDRLRFRHRANFAIMIKQAFTGLGIGGKLIREVISWCEENDIEQIELDVVSTNTRAINFYKSFGFTIVGEIPNALKYLDGTYADELIMICQIKNNK